MTPRMWLFLTVPVTLISILVCVKTFLRMARTSFAKGLVTAPVLPEQHVDFPVGGDITLYLEGRLGTTKFSGLRFSLIDAAGQVAPGHGVLFRWRQTTLQGRVRLEERNFSLPEPGRYRLQTTGIRPGEDYSDCGLTFARSGALGSPLLLFAGAFLGLVGAIGGIVFSAQILAGLWDGKARAPSPSAAGPAPGPSSQGRQLAADRAAVSEWQAVVWAEQNLRFQVPPRWRETERSSQELGYESPQPHPADLRWRVIPMPAIVPAESMRAALAAKARDDLRAGLIEGYELRRLGGVSGVLTIQQRRDGAYRLVVWEGYVEQPQQVRNVTLVLTPGPGQFEGSQAVLRAILDSVRLE